MSQYPSPREFRDEIVGRTIAGVIARPGRAGEPPIVLMMRFDDGSVIEFVSPRSDRVLQRCLRSSISNSAAKPVRQAQNESQLTLDSVLGLGVSEDGGSRYGQSVC